MCEARPLLMWAPQAFVFSQRCGVRDPQLLPALGVAAALYENPAEERSSLYQGHVKRGAKESY